VPPRARHADRPPSADPPYEQPTARPGAPGRPGAQPGPPGPRQALWVPTEVIEVKPSACAGGPTACLDPSPDDPPQVIERPEIPRRVRHVVGYEASCPHCGQVTNAPVPPEAAAGQGPRLTALLGDLAGSQRSRRRAVHAFGAAVLGVHRSRGAIQRAVDRVSEALQSRSEAMAAKAREATGNALDETAWYQPGVLAWVWGMVHSTVAFLMGHTSRRQTAFEALIKRWAGLLVSEGSVVSGQWAQARQTALAHLLRRARGLSERQAPALADGGRRGLAERQRLGPGATAPPPSAAVHTW
jgi:transposase